MKILMPPVKPDQLHGDREVGQAPVLKCTAGAENVATTLGTVKMVLAGSTSDF